ncbi:MAG: hypothetical protein LBK00_04565 [Treponema sp.]|jgi:hypothetical protein|nr:hypothetical protein [Treponema sp.]
MSRLPVTCITSDVLDIDDIAESGGALKSRDDSDMTKIKKSLKKFGISFPFFIWKSGGYNYCLDGHGRRLGLLALRSEGYEIPPCPVVYIDAENEEEAKQKMLRLNSRYGLVTKDGVMSFVKELAIDFDELQIPAPEHIFFDLQIKDVDKYFNTVIDDTPEKKPRICPHCGKILP